MQNDETDVSLPPIQQHVFWSKKGIDLKPTAGIIKLQDSAFTFTTVDGQILLTLPTNQIKKFTAGPPIRGSSWEITPVVAQKDKLRFQTYKGPKELRTQDTLSYKKWLVAFKQAGVPVTNYGIYLWPVYLITIGLAILVLYFTLAKK